MKPFLDLIRQVDFSTIISRVESRASYYFIIEKFRHHTGQTRTSEDAGGGRKYSNADHNKPVLCISPPDRKKKKETDSILSRVEAVLLACLRTNRPRRGHLPVYLVAGVTNHHCITEAKIF